MKNPLIYLFFTKLKNNILSILKSPAKLIYVVLVIGFIIFIAFTGRSSGIGADSELRDIHELYAIITAVYALMFVLIARNGFGNGATIFTMPDINFLFPAPIKNTIILFYGLIQQMGTSLLLGFFLLFQYSWMSNVYGVNYAFLIYVILGYAVVLFCAQLTGMLIYIFSTGSDAKRNAIQIAFYGIVAGFVAFALFYVAQDQSRLLERLVEVANSFLFRMFPVAGWISGVLFGAMTADMTVFFVGLALIVLYIAALIVLTVKSKVDYYEDVLKSTEITYSAITAKKQGQVSEVIPKNVKVGKTGFAKGMGADAFYYKHLIENRRARLFLIDTSSLIFVVSTIVLAFFMRDVGISAVFVTSTYMQVFTIALGRFIKELGKPYIYLVPDPPFMKMLQGIRESINGFVFEALLIYIPVAFILGLSPLDFLLCVIARVSFAVLFLSGNMLCERVFGSASKIFLYIFYFVSLLIVSIPGIALAIILRANNILLISEEVTIFTALIVCNIPVALLVLYLCRDVLQYAELNNK